MLIIGLTGGIGSGKTTVSDLFAQKGVPIIDTDLLARQVTLPDTEGYKAILHSFGPQFLKEDKTLDRHALRKYMFAHPAEKKTLEAILHPLIREKIKAAVDKVTYPYCMVVIPLLFETTPNPLIQRILVVDSPEALQKERVLKRDAHSLDTLDAIIQSQVSRGHRQKYADDIIVNDRDIAHLKAQIDNLHAQYLQLSSESTLLGSTHLVLQNLLGNLPQYIFWKDIDSRYLGVNQKFLEFTELKKPEDILGKTDIDIGFSQAEADMFRADDIAVLRGDKRILFEETVRKRNGEEIVLLVSKVPFLNQHGEVIGILGISTDISEKKRHEKENIEAMKLLTGAVAHELRNPLAAIATSVELLKMSGHLNQLDKEAQSFFKKYIENSQKAVKDAAHMMDMLLIKLRNLSIAEINTSKFSTCNMREDIEDALKDYPFLPHELELIDFPTDSFDFNYRGDKVLTKHIFYNLIKNALKVIKEVKKGDMSLRMVQNKNNCVIYFKDTAKGVSPDYISKMFEKFETTDYTNSGAGLGLAFCKLVMQSYGGDITCHSIDGEYTEFALIFPKIIEI
jgi:dephospho-CoA kinase